MSLDPYRHEPYDHYDWFVLIAALVALAVAIWGGVFWMINR